MSATHFQQAGKRHALCGIMYPALATDDIEAATCKRCERTYARLLLKQHRAREEHAAALRREAAELVAEAKEIEAGATNDVFDNDVWLIVDRVFEGRQGFARGGRQEAA